MHIAIDARAWRWTGIGRYIRNLTKEYLCDQRGHTFTLLVPHGEEKRIAEELQDTKGIFRYVGVEASYYSFREQAIFLQQLHALEDVDLVHFAHFNVPIFYTRPFIVTIHDITRFIFPGQKKQSLMHQIAYEYVFAAAVRHAKAVIAVSNTTARDMALLPVQEKKISVIYEGINDVFFQAISDEQRARLRAYIATNDRYIVFVGVWMSHKNLFRLIDAFRNVLAVYPELKLVITGRPQQGYSDVVGYAHAHNVQHSIIFPGFVPDDLLPVLYAEASLMAFPSLYEGYGLPPLEAAACGVPIVSSNVSSMPELLGDCVEYVNPESVEDIARGILRVLGTPNYAKELASRARAHVAKYGMRTMAQEHIRVYENALQ